MKNNHRYPLVSGTCLYFNRPYSKGVVGTPQNRIPIKMDVKLTECAHPASSPQSFLKCSPIAS
jgi:hypothetical protein